MICGTYVISGRADLGSHTDGSGTRINTYESAMRTSSIATQNMNI